MEAGSGPCPFLRAFRGAGDPVTPMLSATRKSRPLQGRGKSDRVPQPAIDLWPAANKRGDYRYFGSVLIGSALFGSALNLTPLGPAKARYRGAVTHGLAAVSLMAARTPMGWQRQVMAEFTTAWPLKPFGWLATTAMAAEMFVMQGE